VGLGGRVELLFKLDGLGGGSHDRNLSGPEPDSCILQELRGLDQSGSLQLRRLLRPQ